MIQTPASAPAADDRADDPAFGSTDERAARASDESPAAALPDASARAQAQRRAEVQGLHRQFWFDQFDDQGEYVGKPSKDFRHRMWHAISFLAGQGVHIRRANAMLGHLLPLEVDHFWASGVSSILARFRDRLDADLRSALTDKLADALPKESPQKFRGYNDNFPSMAAISSIVGGEICENPDAVAGGIANLKTMRGLLRRRGSLTEYASPTYSPITLTCLAEIVELAKSDEARELALAGEQRVWMNLASRFHPGTSFIAGPHSRAYMVDMVAHTHNAHVSLYQVLGEAVFVNPVSAMFSRIEGQAIHGGSGLSMGHGSWQTMPTYHPTAEALKLAIDKPLPMTVESDTEQGGFSRNVWQPQPHPRTPYAEFAAGPAHLTTHLSEDYALGTSSRVCMDGYQHTGAHLVYRRRRPSGQAPARLHDVGALFSRYLHREKQPDRHKHLGDEGRTVCLQHESTAVIAAWPKLGWGSKPGHVDATVEPTSSLKLSLFVPEFWSRPEDIWLGRSRCEGWSGQSQSPCSVYVKDGPVMLAIHPLALDDHGRDAAVGLHEENGFGIIDLINYRGNPRTFTAPELLGTRNGFVIQVASEHEGIDFATFRNQPTPPTTSPTTPPAASPTTPSPTSPLSSQSDGDTVEPHLDNPAPEPSPNTTITDRYDRDDAMRYISFHQNGLTLEMALSPVSEGIKYRQVNGQLVGEPKLRIPGINPTDLPWCAEDS